jgi:hypothetical protein
MRVPRSADCIQININTTPLRGSVLVLVNKFRTDLISHFHFCLLTSILAHEVQRRDPVYGIDGHIRTSLGLALVASSLLPTAITDEYNILIEA